MQTSNHNVNISGSQPTIIQVAKNNSTATLIQNGQHLLIGKLEQNINSSMDNQSGNNTNNNMQGIYPLQYIEAAVANSNSNQGNSDVNNTTVYGTSGQKLFYQDSNIYTSMSGQTTTIIPASAIQHIKARDLSGATVGSTVHIQATPHAQIVHHGGNAYLVQSSTRMEDESPNMSHTTKASPVTVQWLCDNYETADGVSLPRSTLYNHYLQHCQQEKLEPMNQASFGKLIRSVFFGLRTRRLGTRGNSKYHYYGIRIKPNSVLNHYVEDQSFAIRQYPSFHRQNQDNDIHFRNRYSGNFGGNGGGGFGGAGGSSGQTGSGFTLNMSAAGECGGTNIGGATTMTPGTNQHSSYLGESSSALPNLPEIMKRAELDRVTEDECQTEGVTVTDIGVFCQLYLDHSDAVLSSVVYLNFKFIESLWQDFWRTSPPTTGGGGGTKQPGGPGSPSIEDKLPRATLARLLRLRQVQTFLQLFDNVFYQSLVEVLIPNVLRPIPSALTQNIRHFAKSLEGWMSSATAGLHGPVIQIKMASVCSLAQTLRRHTSLNHLAQAARAVLKNASQISQMLTDLNRVDFGNVHEQASWVCGCDSKRVDALQQDFKRILQQQASLEEWAAWLDNVVNDVLEPYKASPRYPHAAHQFILKWSFYSSMVIRDLTLRSAASFGSFHLIRLLYDEYIYYLVEQKVAEHLNLTPVAVTGEMGRQLMASEYGNMAEDGDIKAKFKIESMGNGKDVDLLGGNNGASLGRSISAVDAEYRMMTGPHSNTVDSNQSVSSYNNSNPMADEQVDESADDDEGLDEEETQMHEQLSTITAAVAVQDPRILSATAVNRAFSTTAAMIVQKSEQPLTATTPVAGVHVLAFPGKLPSAIVTNSSVRKTVNVTTFGDPQSTIAPASTAAVETLSSTSATANTTSASTIAVPLSSTTAKIVLAANASNNNNGASTTLRLSPTLRHQHQSSSTIVSDPITGGPSHASKRIKLVNNCSLATTTTSVAAAVPVATIAAGGVSGSSSS